MQMYNQFKGKGPVGGMTIFTSPIMMLLDLDVIKNVMVKDFNVFPNRKVYFNEKDDPLTAHLVNLEDEEWRTLRTKLTPTFTSGKLKMMLPTIIDVTDNLISTLEKAVSINSSVEIKEFLSRYTVDVIGTTAFGLECNR
jgi:cytochrome P450 family 6